MNNCVALADGSMFCPTPAHARAIVDILSERVAHVPEAEQNEIVREIRWWKARQDPMRDYEEWL